MRIIFFLLFIAGCSVISLSQDNNRPTQKQIEVQKQQAIADAKKELIETKRQLAQAKANNDPEAIRQFESQLASLEQMIAMLEKTNLTGNNIPKTLPPSDKKEPAYVSPFSPIKLNQPVKTPTWEQATDKLLWYSGKRIDANTLITPSGLIVRYNRQTNTITLQPPNSGPDPDTIYYGLINTLSQIKPMKNDYAVRMESMMNSFFMFSEIDLAYKEYDMFKNNYYELAKNKRQINQPALNASLESMIQTLADIIQQLPPIQTLPPPKRSNDLCLCEDEAAKARYHNNLKTWVGQFYREEYDILGLLMRIFEKIESLKFLGIAVPSVATSVNDPTQYFEIILERMTAKLGQLGKLYEQGDVLIEDGLVYATLNLFTKKSELGLKNTTRAVNIRQSIDRVTEEIGILIASDFFERYIDDQKSKLKYNTVFDYGLYLAHELNKKMVYPKYEVNANLFNIWMEGLKKFNRFNLTMEMDFHYQIVSKEENDMIIMWATGVVTSESPLYVSLGRHDCHWELYLTDVNHQKLQTSGEEYRIKMKVYSGQKDYVKDLLPPFNYSGPAIIQMVFPTMKINFCGGQSEAVFDIMSFSPPDIKKHEKDDTKKIYSIDILAYINKAIIGAKTTQVNVDQLISTAGEMMNIRSTQLPPSSGDPVLDKLKMNYLLNKKKYELQYNLGQTTHTRRSIALIPEQPGNVFLFYPTYNLTAPNDEDKNYGIMLTKADLFLRVEHSPK